MLAHKPTKTHGAFQLQEEKRRSDLQSLEIFPCHLSMFWLGKSVKITMASQTPGHPERQNIELSERLEAFLRLVAFY